VLDFEFVPRGGDTPVCSRAEPTFLSETGG